VRSAVWAVATVPLTGTALWADRVFVMNEREDQHRTLIRIRFRTSIAPWRTWNIQDRWPRATRARGADPEGACGPTFGPPRVEPGAHNVGRTVEG